MTEKKTVDKKLTGAQIRGVSDSEFNMWRAIFACAHADDVVTQEERRFLRKALNTENFSDEQRRVLEEDIDVKHDIAEMYSHVTDQKHRSKFFYFARMLFWCDGDFAEQEQKILTELAKTHFESVKVDEIAQMVKFEIDAPEAEAPQASISGGWVGEDLHLRVTGLQLEEDEKSWIREDMENTPQNNIGGIMDRFLRRFKA